MHFNVGERNIFFHWSKIPLDCTLLALTRVSLTSALGTTESRDDTITEQSRGGGVKCAMQNVRGAAFAQAGQVGY